MFEELSTVDRIFLQTKQAPERYSVNYWKNYKPLTLHCALNKLSAQVRIPTYVNSYMFRNADLLGEHRTLHGYKTKPNPRYSDESIDEYLKRVSPDYTEFFSIFSIFPQIKLSPTAKVPRKCSPKCNLPFFTFNRIFLHC
jgi:hypothetical protein